VSNVFDANMVDITTAAKYVAAGAGVIVVSVPKFTRATMTAITKISSIDQRPMNFMTRNIKVLCFNHVCHRFWIEIMMSIIPATLKIGTRILAKKIMIAMKYSPDWMKCSIPSIMVLGSFSPR